MASDPSGWSLTESDPQVFTQLLRDLGVKGIQVDDVYSLDAATLAELDPIYAFIFLFKYVGQAEEDHSAGGEVASSSSDPWFASQIINNSCGTVAAINAMLNIPSVKSEHQGESVERGDMLENLYSFTMGMEAFDLGHVLASSDEIREVHNSFSRSSPFSMDPSAFPEREKEDAYHFITYVPVNGTLYELDGLRQAPVRHGQCGARWTDLARETIEARIATYPPGSVMFNVLAVRGAALPRWQRLLKESDSAEQSAYMAEQIQAEQRKAERGRVENTLRQHNLLPAVFSMLKALGTTGLIGNALDQAEAKTKDRRQKEQNETD